MDYTGFRVEVASHLTGRFLPDTERPISSGDALKIVAEHSDVLDAFLDLGLLAPEDAATEVYDLWFNGG